MDAAGRSPRRSFGQSRHNGSRGRRPGERTWEIEMHRLANAHEQELFLAPVALAAAADRLGVSVDSVARRFGEYSRTLERASRVSVDPALLVDATRQPDYLAAARYLQARGVYAPSPVLERLLHVAPGPDARRLRTSESLRRLGMSGDQLRKAA